MYRKEPSEENGEEERTAYSKPLRKDRLCLLKGVRSHSDWLERNALEGEGDSRVWILLSLVGHVRD
jgi:hypothetical protein